MVAMATCILSVRKPKNSSLNSDFTIIIPIILVKNKVENTDWIFPLTADPSYLVRIVLIMHIKCSQADIAHNYVNRKHPEQHIRTIHRI